MSFKKWKNKLPTVFLNCEAMAVNNGRLKALEKGELSLDELELVSRKNVSLSMVFREVVTHQDGANFPVENVGIIFPKPAPHVVAFLSDGLAGNGHREARFGGSWEVVNEEQNSDIFEDVASELNLDPMAGGWLFKGEPEQWASVKNYIDARSRALQIDNNQLYGALVAQR